MGKVTYVTLSSDESIHPQYERALSEIQREFGKHHTMFIDGQSVTSKHREFVVRSPIDTRIILGFFQRGTRSHADEAVASCSKRLSEWSERHWSERVAVIRKGIQLVEENTFPLSALLTYEVGKNRFEAVAEACEIADIFRYYADQMESNDGFVRETCGAATGEPTRSVMKPHGVWAVISPFNFPMALAAQMATAALITGNCVVLKPTTDAPFSGLKLYDLYVRAGVPPGVINFVTVPGSSFGKHVARHPLVAGVAFTGSREVGMKLYKAFVQSSGYPKPFIAEMGSKNPAIVTAKADLDKAAEGVVRGAFSYGGQKCSATSRVYVHNGVKGQFVTRLVSRTSQLATGDPRKREVFVGPVINKRALRNYQKYITMVKQAGGRILIGGNVLKDGLYARGFYATPTIISGLPDNHSLLKEELFVPIVVVKDVRDLKEAIREANDTEYGLTAGIFSEDASELAEFFSKIQFGVTYSNRRGGATTGAWPGRQSFCGWKGSGCTSKGVGGPYYLQQFMREQSQTRVTELNRSTDL